jgi:cytochrome c oxidase subunit 2
MRDKALLITALVLLGVGIVGALVLEALTPLGTVGQQSSLGGAGTSAARGQRIFQSGLDENGREIPRSAIPVSQGALMMGGGGCASCHAANGQGSAVSMMTGYIEAPDITYTTLTNAGYTDRTIYRAIRYGIDEENKNLNPAMPRWQMTDSEVRDVVAYLKELSGQ